MDLMATSFFDLEEFNLQYKILPKKTIQALIIHKRCGRAGMVQPTIGTKAVVVKVTLLHMGGREAACRMSKGALQS
jgi:hypothetical protein